MKIYLVIEYLIYSECEIIHKAFYDEGQAIQYCEDKQKERKKSKDPFLKNVVFDYKEIEVV